MTVFNNANALRVGSSTVSKVYMGATQVWPASTGYGDLRDIASLALWLDSRYVNGIAGTNPATGAAVASWSDLSLLAYPAVTQATSNKRPTIASYTNGTKTFPAVLFNGTSHALTTPTVDQWGSLAQNQGAITVISVARTATIATGNRNTFHLGRDASTTAARIGVGMMTANWRGGSRRLDGDAFTTITGPTATVNTWVVQSVVFHYSSAIAYHYINGTLNTTVNPFLAAGNVSNTTSDYGAIGSSITGTAEYWNGAIASVAVLRSASDTDRIAAENYLKTAFGIT